MKNLEIMKNGKKIISLKKLQKLPKNWKECMKITKSWNWKKMQDYSMFHQSIMNAMETIFLLKICLTTSLRNLGPLPKQTGTLKMHNFSLKSNMKRHIKSIHEKKTSIKCTICDKNFSQTGTLKMHIESVHENNRPLKYLQYL